MKKIWFAVAALACLSLAAFADDQEPREADDIVGVWETAHENDDYSRVEIYEEDGKYYGRIVWLLNPVYPDDAPDGVAGMPVTDFNNPDKEKRDQPILGLRMLRDFEFKPKDNEWQDGRIYDPEDGKDYRCRLSLPHRDTLDVYGYVKVLFTKIGRNTTWTRVPDSVWTPGSN